MRKVQITTIDFTDMDISELPEEYRKLAEKRRTETDSHSDSNFLPEAFDWPSTPEGAHFWIQCENARRESELPPLPEEE